MLKTRQCDGPVARTCATTHMLDRIAAYYGLNVSETPVGFKYIGQCFLNEGSIIGGEESGGMSIRGHVPEKDGILGAVLVAEMAAVEGKSLEQIQRELHTQFGRLVSRRTDVHVSPAEKEEKIEKVKRYSPTRLGGQPVAERVTIDGTKLVNADGSWVLIRPSGTEPVFRVYVEANGENQLDQILGQVREDLNM